MIVSVTSLAPGRGRLQWKSRVVDCTLGKGGARVDKHEGDGATPIGRYTFRRVLFRADKAAAPRTRLPTAPIAQDDGWCDASGDAAYNRPVKLPYPASAERLWRDDALYDIVVVLGHNDDPVVDGAGSAIFMHLRRDDHGPTEGCVGLARDDLLDLLANLQPGDEIEISAA
jgi:L,D-peptidoglycan transpeptidase YkuD (ErfK/YbiS/YcfS/YnhG family)